MTLLANVLRDGVFASRPAASAVTAGTLYAATDTKVVYQSDGTSWSTWLDASGTGGGGVATDPIWTTAGQIAVATGSAAASALGVGSTGKIPTSNGTTLAYSYPPGHEFDYVTQTSDLSVTATTAATAQAFLTGNAVSYDGSTRIKIEWWSPNISGNGVAIAELYDGATDQNLRIGQVAGAAAGQVSQIGYGVYFLTPSNASHTYAVKFWRSVANMTVNGNSGGTFCPAWMRQTLA